MNDTKWLTKKEIAAKYGVSIKTVDLWVGQQDWPPKGDKRGLYDTYEAAAVEAVLAARRNLAAVSRLRKLGTRLVTPREVGEIIGQPRSTMAGHAHRGLFGEGVEKDGVMQYRANAVADYLESRRPRRRPAAD